MAAAKAISVDVENPREVPIEEAVAHVSMEAELLRTAASRSDYQQFRTIITDKVLLPEARAILTDIGQWYDANPALDVLDWGTFLAWARLSCRSTWKPDKWDVYAAICKHAASLAHPNPAILQRYKELKAYGAIRVIIEDAIATNKPTAMAEIIKTAEDVSTSGVKCAGLVSEDWDALLAEVTREEGLEWRLEELNVSVGPIGRGDVIMIGKRPEVGGTTFLASELSYMAPQLEKGKHAIIFTNEEIGAKVKMRVIQSALGATLGSIASAPDTHKRGYEAMMGDHRIDIVHDTAITDTLVERWLRSGDYGLIGVNVLDKIILTKSGNEGADLKRDLGIWARGVADKYGPVIGVLQAGAEAEGQQWPDQSCLYGSKTGLQAESDVLLMIGKTHNPAEADQRFIGVVRNKLPGGRITVPAMRHARWCVGFDGERGRFISKLSK